MGAEPSGTAEPPAEGGDPAAETPEARDVELACFTGKVETVDLIDEIIADFNAQSNGVTVEQEYQNYASNIIKIKFAAGAAPRRDKLEKLEKAMDGIRDKFGRDAIAPASTVHRDRAEVKAEQRLPPVD